MFFRNLFENPFRNPFRAEVPEQQARGRRVEALPLHQLSAEEVTLLGPDEVCSLCINPIQQIAGPIFSHPHPTREGEFIHAKCGPCWRNNFTFYERQGQSPTCPECRQTVDPSGIPGDAAAQAAEDPDMDHLRPRIRAVRDRILRGERPEPFQLFGIGAMRRIANPQPPLQAERRRNEGIISNFIDGMIAVKDYIVEIVRKIFKGIGEILNNIYWSINDFCIRCCAGSRTPIPATITPIRS